MELKKLISEFLWECEIRKYSSKTIKGYRNNLTYIANYFEQSLELLLIEEIGTPQIRQYFKYQSSKGRKATYLNGQIKVLRAFFKYLIQEEYIQRNPMLNISWMREKMPLIKTFTNIEVKRMLDVYKERDYLTIRNKAILYMLLDTGIRCSELCMLSLDNINSKSIYVFGKGNKEREVGNSPLLSKVIFRYIQHRNRYFEFKNVDNRLFLSRTGKPLTVEAVERVIRYAGEKAGINEEIRCSPHTCRHYFAQAQLKNGIDVYSLSRVLGHNNISITQRYLQSISDTDVVDKSIKTSPLMNL